MPALEPGVTLQKRYTVQEVIGRGGMGTVYLAETIIFAGRKVAIKQMDPIHDPEEAIKYSAQFLREAQLLGGLHHPGLVEVKDYFEENGALYLVMEYVQGTTLETIIRNQVDLLPLDKVVGWMREIFSILEYLHAHDPPIIFQDLKPSNLMLSDSGQLRLIDFGIARTIDPTIRTITLTKGAGTPGYAAPEQHSGICCTNADIYAAGATMYALLTCVVPPPSLHLLLGSAELVPPASLNADVGPAIEDVIYRMMALLAANRYQTVGEAREALEQALKNPSVTPSAPRTSLIPGNRPLTSPPSAGASPPAAGSSASSLRLRRPSDGAGVDPPSSGARLSASSEPELQVRRPSGDLNKMKSRPMPRTCPGCGTVLEAGQICTRCLPAPRASVVVQPKPDALSAAALETHDISDPHAPPEDRKTLMGLFRRDSSNRSVTATRPTVRRDKSEGDSPVQVVSFTPGTLVFHATEWFDLGQQLWFNISVTRDGSSPIHSGLSVQPCGILVTPRYWRYTANVIGDVKPDLARYLRAFPPQTHDKERRTEPRQLCKFRVTSPDLPSYQAISTDVSPSGLALLTAGPVEVNQTLTLRLDFDDDRFPHVVCKNLVRWCYYGLEGEFRAGTRLVEVNPKHSSILQGYLEFLRHQKARWST